MRERLLIMAKYPRLGFCKTRLVPPLTLEQALRVHEACLERMLEQAAAFDSVLYLAEAPGPYQNRIPERPQRGGDLGERMRLALEAELATCDRAILVGCDAPSVDADLLRQAFAALNVADVALGPANDGGYYLIGLKRPCPALFRDMKWGGGGVLAATRQRAAEMGLSCQLLPTLVDIDHWADLRQAALMLDPRQPLARLLQELALLPDSE